MGKDFNEEKSLELINEMITQARSNFQKGAGNGFLMAGYSVAILAILNIVLIFTLPNPHQSCWIWVLAYPIQFIWAHISRK